MTDLIHMVFGNVLMISKTQLHLNSFHLEKERKERQEDTLNCHHYTDTKTQPLSKLIITTIQTMNPEGKRSVYDEMIIAEEKRTVN